MCENMKTYLERGITQMKANFNAFVFKSPYIWSFNLPLFIRITRPNFRQRITSFKFLKVI